VHHGIYALLVHLGKAYAHALEKQVTGVLGVVQVVGVVYYALDVAFVVAHFHARFKDIFHFQQILGSKVN
jgi:hypothetical protein